MPVNSTHKEYDAISKKVNLTADVIAGDDEVKAKKELYVPRLSEQTDTGYKAYLNRPVLHNYTELVLKGMVGLAFSKPPLIEVPTTMDSIILDIDRKGSTVENQSHDCLKQVQQKGRVGLLVDMSTAPSGITLAEKDKLNIRPYISIYNHESIINWKYSLVNNQTVLTKVVLRETVTEPTEDEFVDDEIVVYRVLSLVDGIYTVRVLKEDGTAYTDEVTPKIDGKPMNHIPFYPITKESLLLSPTTPPLYELAKINLTHFKVDVDFYHGMHFSALPTPYITGHQLDKGQKVEIGSTSFLTIPSPDAKLGFLEFNGQGLQTHEREKEALIKAMVALGSNMLQGDKKVAEAEATVRMRNAGQNANLSTIVQFVSEGYEKALNMVSTWGGYGDDVKFEINTEFETNNLNGKEVIDYVNAWLSDGISEKDLFWNLKRGGAIQDSKTFEEWQTEKREASPQVGE